VPIHGYNIRWFGGAMHSQSLRERKTWLGYKDVKFQNDESGKSLQRFHSGGGRKSMKRHFSFFFSKFFTSQIALIQKNETSSSHPMIDDFFIFCPPD